MAARRAAICLLLIMISCLLLRIMYDFLTAIARRLAAMAACLAFQLPLFLAAAALLRAKMISLRRLMIIDLRYLIIRILAALAARALRIAIILERLTLFLMTTLRRTTLFFALAALILAIATARSFISFAMAAAQGLQPGPSVSTPV